MRFFGFYKKSEYRSVTPGMHRFAISTDYPDIDRSEDGYVPAEGYIFSLPEDTKIEVIGEWDEKDLILRVERLIPSTEDKKLSLTMLKNIIKDIQKEDPTLKIPRTLPKEILKVTGDDILTYVKKHMTTRELKDKLSEDNLVIADIIWPKVRAAIASYDIIPFIASFGITPFAAEKLAQKYGPQALNRIKSKPFKVGAEVGLSFLECDRIAKEEKIDPMHPDRIGCAVFEVLKNESESSGSTYMLYPEVHEGVRVLLSRSSYPDKEVSYMVLYLTILGDKRFHLEETEKEIRIALRYLYNYETRSIRHIKRLQRSKDDPLYDPGLIDKFEKEMGMEYNGKQREAVSLCHSSGIKIITGGPGTGKTTVIRGLIYVYTSMHPKNKIALCAPTGRAAQRMSDVVKGLKATTVHKLLDIRLFDTEKILKDESNPIDADMIIVDEVSMLDTELLSELLAAIKKGSTLILVGDSDQLKSVGAGNVLGDMIGSEKFETIKLDFAYRQKSGSKIIENAHKILTNDPNLLPGKDFKIEKFLKMEDAAERIRTLFNELYDSKDPMKVQILCDVKKDMLGVSMLNKMARDNLFPGETHLTIGDKVIFIKNNYEYGYYNGDTGIITDIKTNEIHININGNLVKVPKDYRADIKSAYAITIHKSQGSEYDTVIISLPDKPKNMLTRNLLYTAVTRAKKCVILIATGKAVETAVETVPLNKVKTNFKDLLKGL